MSTSRHRGNFEREVFVCAAWLMAAERNCARTQMAGYDQWLVVMAEPGHVDPAWSILGEPWEQRLRDLRA